MSLSKATVKSAPLLLRDPTLSRTHVSFSYAGNIWIADRDGGNVRRLTSGGREAKPSLSPDGQYIAFAAEYDGPRGVYVLPIAGGEPRRLTHHSADLGESTGGRYETIGWTPNGKEVLFSSRRAAFATGVFTTSSQLFTVPAEGGFATPLPLIRAAQGSFSPDAKRIAYVPNIQSQPEWKNYRGGQTTPIWIADLTDSSIQARIPRDNSNDFNPMWVGETIYFLSDRDGPVTLYVYDPRSRQTRQVLQNRGFDIKSAAASSDAIVYEKFGGLHWLDLNSGADHPLDIRPVADFLTSRPYFRNLADIVAATGPDLGPDKVIVKISPEGARAVLGVRGEIFTVPAKKGVVRNLTGTPGVVERDPAWSPDGSSIAYFSDESGDYALHVRDQSGSGEVRKIQMGDPPSFYYAPTWSPDSSKICYTDRLLNYWYVDLASGMPVRIDTDLCVDPIYRRQMAWSPDSRWLAYTKQLPSLLHALFVYSLAEARTYQLTDGMSDTLHVAFDKGGQYLYFTASTDTGLNAGWADMTSFWRPITRAVYALALTRGIPSPLAFQSDEECVRGAQENDRINQIRPPSFAIDPEGIMERMVRLPIPARNYSGLFVGKPGNLILLEGPAVVEHLKPLSRYQLPTKAHRFDLATRETREILDGVLDFDLAFNGGKMLYARQNRANLKQWFISALDNSAGTARAVVDEVPLKLDMMDVYIDPRVEWQHMYEQAWRTQRDCFYDPGLHGLNLEEAKKKYQPFLENVVTRNDLDYLFGEMLANLSVGHMWVVSGRDAPKAADRDLGLLGADYSIEKGRYRLARIYGADPWNPQARAPLTELGVNVRTGEYLLAVNGRDIRAPVDVYSYFAHTAGTQVVLKIGPEPDGQGSRDIAVVPIKDELALRHFAWIEDNRSKVDRLTRGRVAYVYLPDTAGGGYTNFNRYFFAQTGKDAVIIDERYNRGGFNANYILDCLHRSLLSYHHMRDGRDITRPMQGIFGPKVMLINEMAGSGGDYLPWAFRRMGIGPLIGKRTWGGLVGHYNATCDLLDGGYVLSPNMAFYNPEGAWEIENHGVKPDIEVEDDPKAARAGHDVQLEKAIEVVLDLLEKAPPPSAPKRPPYPRYHGPK